MSHTSINFIGIYAFLFSAYVSRLKIKTADIMAATAVPQKRQNGTSLRDISFIRAHTRVHGTND